MTRDCGIASRSVYFGVCLIALLAASPATASPAGTSADVVLDRIRDDAGPALQRADAVRAAAARGLGALVAEVADSRAGVVRPASSVAGLVDAARAVRRGVAQAAGGDRPVTLPRFVAADDGARSEAPRAQATVDAPAIKRLAATLASEIEAAMPFLRGWAAAGPRGIGGHCDIVDELPYLCVGGAGANSYSSDAMVTIDLGGDDRYTNSSGGANGNLCGLGTLDPQRPYCQVSVVIDLDGADVYQPTAGRADSVGQSAILGSGIAAIGVIVDENGDDVYATATDETDRHLAVHGFGALGVGVLRDARGNDRYTAASVAPVRAAVSGQGYGGLAAIGILHDAQGDDVYSMHAGPSTEVSSVHGQGSGEFQAVGLLIDDAGSDSLAIEAVAESSPADAPRIDLAVSSGQGSALAAGDGMLLTGDGDTRYDARARSSTSLLSNVPAATTRVQGISMASGTGMLDDRGGNDSYDSRAEAAARFETVAADDCACTGAEMVVEQFNAPAASVYSQAYSSPLLGPLTPETALALLTDHAGDDVYQARARVSVEAEARDLRPDGAARVDFVTPIPSSVHIHTRGEGSTAPAIMADLGGNDTYSSAAEGIAAARAVAAPGRPASARSVAPRAYAVGHAGGAHGTFADIGGRDDYSAVARSRASSFPDPAQAVDLMSQGAFFGEFGGASADIDGGEADTYLIDPQREILFGRRGQVAWSNGGLGLATSSAPKAVASIEILGVGSRSDGGHIPVDVRLTTDAGALAGREVWVEVAQANDIGLLNPIEGSAHAITDSDGRARLMLDYDFATRSAGAGRAREIHVRFSGDRQLLPALAHHEV